MIPPEQNAAFVAAMEDVLEVCRQPHDPRHPVVAMDEQPVQLVKETRWPIPARPGQPRRIDYEYERAGTAAAFVFTAPLAHWRRWSVRPRRTATDWAEALRVLIEDDSPDAERVVLICDNLNTHTIGAFYETFPPAAARSLVERLEIHHAPKHGSWLNVAECELSMLTRQCLHGRTGSIAALEEKVRSWEDDRNHRQCGVQWHFTTADARVSLRRLHPQVQLS